MSSPLETASCRCVPLVMARLWHDADQRSCLGAVAATRTSWLRPRGSVASSTSLVRRHRILRHARVGWPPAAGRSQTPPSICVPGEVGHGLPGLSRTSGLVRSDMGPAAIRSDPADDSSYGPNSRVCLACQGIDLGRRFEDWAQRRVCREEGAGSGPPVCLSPRALR